MWDVRRDGVPSGGGCSHVPRSTSNRVYAAFTSLTSFDSDAFASPNNMLVAGA